LISAAVFMYVFNLFDSKYLYIILSFTLLTVGIATVITAKKDVDYDKTIPN
jgi:hypothetical protein